MVMGWAGLAGLLGGCSGSAPAPVDEGEVPLTAADATLRLAELEPVEMRVHALTRVERGGGGMAGASAAGARVLVHLELLDQFGQGVKGLGRVVIELRVRGLVGSKTEAPPTTDTPPQEQPARAGAVQRYVRDLSEPKPNADAFDWVTRCYVVPCGDLSPELREAAARGELEVRATMSVLRLDGTRRALSASAALPAAR